MIVVSVVNLKQSVPSDYELPDHTTKRGKLSGTARARSVQM